MVACGEEIPQSHSTTGTDGICRPFSILQNEKFIKTSRMQENASAVSGSTGDREYADAAAISSFAAMAVQEAADAGILLGTAGNLLRPRTVLQDLRRRSGCRGGNKRASE